jgi:hypothetical protein
MIRAYTQNHLRRALAFLDASHQMLLANNALVAMSNTRSVIETVANYWDYEQKLQPLIDTGDVDEIHKFVHTRAFATRKKKLIKHHDEPLLQVEQILNQIDAMKKVRPSIRDDYDHLSEFAHPNAMGSTIYFQDFAAPEVAHYRDDGIEVDGLKWVLIGGFIMGYMHDAIIRVNARLPELSELGKRYKRKETP